MKPTFLKSTLRATALLGVLTACMSSCSTPSDFQVAGKPQVTLKHIKILSDAKGHLDEAQKEFRSGKIAEAEALLKKALQESLPNKEYKIAYDCYINIGRCEDIKGNQDEAEKYFRQTVAFAQKHFPNNKSKTSDAIAGLGVALAKQGNTKGAEKLLRKAVDIRISQENWAMAIDHALKMNWLYQNTKQPAKQIEILSELIELHRMSGSQDTIAQARFYLDKGRTELSIKKNDDALTSLKAAQLQTSRATQLQEPKESNASLEAAKLNLELAELFQEIGKPNEAKKAISNYSKILDNSPDPAMKRILKEQLNSFKKKQEAPETENSREE